MITKLRSNTFRNFAYLSKDYQDRLVVDKSTSNVVSNRKSFTKLEKIQIVIEGQSNDICLEEYCENVGVELKTFQKWSSEFLIENSVGSSNNSFQNSSEFENRFANVKEAKSGQTSVAEICRREGISHDQFLDWCKEIRLFFDRDSILTKLNEPIYQKNKAIVTNNSSTESFRYFENYIDFSLKRTAIIMQQNSQRLLNSKNLMQVVSLKRLNDVRYINKYLENVNDKMQNDGILIGCLETFAARKERSRINKIPFLKNIYFMFEFLIKRILPKVSFTKKYYFQFTQGNDRLMSKAEGLGRLVSCGFKIIDYKSIDGVLYFVVKKVREPYFDEQPSYGPVYKMPRLGKNGKIIGVYKFRTMHPYSEYLQDYIVNAHGYAETGKPADDFRIPVWGKFMRRFWLDEIPQLFNVLKGELKLVGIRPVSKRYFQDIPLEMQKLRLTQKPGCIPPYVALNRNGNVLSVLQSEKEYLEEKIENPYFTDLKYFFKAIFNIVVRNKRSA